MRVLVTGAGGFVGTHLIGQLAAAGHEVVALYRSEEGRARREPARPGIVSAVVDLNHADRVAACLAEHRPEALFHLAWYANPADYLVSRENLASLTATSGLVESALASGCGTFVMAGSCAEYARKDRILTEEDPVDPQTLYGACKHAAWLVARALAAAAGARLVWGRVFHLHGPGEDGRRLIPWVAEQVRAGRAVDLTDGTQVRDHLHVADVASGLLTLLSAPSSGIYNICSGEPVSLRHVLEIVGELAGDTSLLRFGARSHRPGEAMFLAGDSARLRQLGWAPRFGLRDGLADGLRPLLRDP